MKNSDFVQLAERVLPSLAGFIVSDGLCVVAPFSGTFRGFQFEASAFDKNTFYVNAFFLPLCVPTKSFHTTFGHRIGQNGHWNFSDSMLLPNLTGELEKEAPLLLGLDTALDVAAALEPLAKRGNLHSIEAYAYTLILAGQAEAGMERLNDLLRVLDQAITWHQEIGSRAALIRDNLIYDLDNAIDQLAIWERTTARDLGIEKLLKSG